MTAINRIVIAPFSAEDMYALVDDINSYPEFLPWCAGADCRRDGNNVNASLRIAYRGLRTSFATANTHTPPQHIHMRLQSGPLSSLNGEWRFIPLEARRCRVEFDLSYTFKNKVMEKLFAGLFVFVFDRFAAHFIERAKSVYGTAGRGNIEVELVQTDADAPTVRRLVLPAGATVGDALAAGGATAPDGVGVFGRLCQTEAPLTNGDRVEIYRPLPNDPRVARRHRTAGGKEGGR